MTEFKMTFERSKSFVLSNESLKINLTIPEEVKTLTITENGTVSINPTDGYVIRRVDLTTNVQPALEEKTATVTVNGTTEVTPSSGKDGLSKVTIITNVHPTVEGDTLIFDSANASVEGDTITL